MIRKKINEGSFLRTVICGGSARIAALTSTASTKLLEIALIARCNALSMLHLGLPPSLPALTEAERGLSAKRLRLKFESKTSWDSIGNDKSSCSANRIRGAIAIHKNAWFNWRPRDQRIQDDETVQDREYPWRSTTHSTGASLARAGGHLGPLIAGTIMCDMISPAEAAGAHETGAAAFAMMLLAYFFQFLEGTSDVAAAVAEHVVAMSDSITTTGIEQIEIAMPEIRCIFVATFAAIVLVFF